MSNSKVGPSEPSEEPIEEPLEELEEEPIESISIKKIVKKLKQQHKKDESTVKEMASLKNGVPEHGMTDKKRKHSKSFYRERISKERKEKRQAMRVKSKGKPFGEKKAAKKAERVG